MALVDYGSDSGSGSDDDGPAAVPAAVAPKPAAAATAPPPRPAGAAASSSSSANPRKRPLSPTPPPQPLASASGIVLPPPKSSFRRKPVKMFSFADVEPRDASAAAATTADDDAPPPAKAPKLTASTSGSALLSMLPPPKQAAPKAKALPAPVRLRPLQLDAEGRIDSFDQPAGAEADEPAALDFSRKGADGAPPAAGGAKMDLVRPLSLAAKGKGKAAAPAKEAEIDFFGLGASTPSSSSSLPKPASKQPTTISAAPKVAPFRPPSPTPDDAYPGYYLHPHTKEWQAYEPAYYQAYFARWQAADGGADAGGRAFEGVRDGREDLVDVSASETADVAALPPVRPGTSTVVEPPKPKIIQSKAGRHNQLSALVNNAKANREAIEEQIAKAKRNKRASGQSYGFR